VATVTNIERNAAYAFARITCTPAAGVNSYGQVLVVGSQAAPLENPLAQGEPAATQPGQGKQ
jgi:rod shape-determining protein MreC